MIAPAAPPLCPDCQGPTVLDAEIDRERDIATGKLIWRCVVCNDESTTNAETLLNPEDQDPIP